MTYIYTLAFIKRDNEVLMINRVKNPWQGMWNGVGGKREKDEDALSCIIREIAEETGILVSKDEVLDKGTVIWNNQTTDEYNGLHLYVVELDSSYQYQTPMPTPEGILDWKDISWVKDEKNLGVAYNIRYFIDSAINDPKRYQYTCTFNGNTLENVTIKEIK